MVLMESKKEASGFAPILLTIGVLVLAALAVFAFVPLVECRRCDAEGQFSFEGFYAGKPALYVDYCDCGTFWEIGSTGKRAKITLLRSLMAPKPLKMKP